MGLTEAEWKSLQKMAQHCADTWRGDVPLRVLPYHERHVAALDGMIGHLAAHGWDSDKALFRAGAAMIGREASQRVKHASRAWWSGDRLDPDWLAEMVTDQIAARQVLAALTPGERNAVLLAVDNGGKGQRGRESNLLTRARRRARSLWVAPGETPRGRYTHRTRAEWRRHYYDAKARRLWA